MIVVDASALLAILLHEDDEERFARFLAQCDGAVASAINYWEALVRAASVHGPAGQALVDDLLAKLNVRVESADGDLAHRAALVFERFRGRPARLNLGDSFAYALAEREGEGLLFKGNDFPETDIKSALP